MGAIEPGQHAEARPAGAISDRRIAVVEKPRIAAKLVDEEALDEGRILRIDHGFGAHELRNHPAAIDIADENHRHAFRLRETHIGDVAGAQIDLGGGARALHQHEIRLTAQDGEAFAHARQQLWLELRVIARARRREALALDDDLRAGLAFRLEQDRVHVDRRRYARSPSLERLGAPDLAAAIIGDGGVVRHVLRLERAHAKPAPGINPRESRDEHGFADIRAGALDHQCGAHDGMLT
jgi:hypothetical protein